METKHTAGPWEVANAGGGVFVIHDKKDRRGRQAQIATCYIEADANLMAAAPDLLEAAEETQEDISDVRQLAAKLLDSRNRSLTGTEAERVAHLLRYLDRISRVSHAAIAKANG